jgi:Domain of unknown function (DUF1918)
MNASIGDHIVLRGHRKRECDRRGEIVEVRGVAGAAPYVVRWPMATKAHSSAATSRTSTTLSVVRGQLSDAI